MFTTAPKIWRNSPKWFVRYCVHKLLVYNNNNLHLITVETNCSTLHMAYNIQHAGSNDTTCRLSHRTAATTRFSPEGIGCQKQSAPRFCQHPIRWAFTSQAYIRWRHQSTHPINRPNTHLLTPEG